MATLGASFQGSELEADTIDAVDVEVDAREMGPHRIVMRTDMLQAARKGDVNAIRAMFSPTTKPVSATLSNNGIEVPSLVDQHEIYDDIFGVTAGGNTVLHIAACHGWLEVAEEICRREPSLIPAANVRLDSALHCSARAGHHQVVSFIINAMGEDLQGILRARNLNGDTALHEAVRGGHVRVAEKLIAADIGSLSMVNEAGISPLYLAVVGNSRCMVEAILQASCSPMEVAHAGPGRRTALHAAVLRCQETARMLLKWKPELAKEADEDNSIPLHYVAADGDANAAHLLLEHDASMAYIADGDGSFAIHVAASMGRVGVVHALLMHCPDSDELLDHEGRNFVHVAVAAGRRQLITHLLRMPMLGKLLNERDWKGNTPLHLAVIAGTKRIVFKLLRDRRVEPNVVNNQGLTPLDLSCTSEPGMSYVFNVRLLITRCLAECGALFSPQRFDKSELSDPEKGKTGEDLEGETKKQLSFSKNLAIASVLIATVTFAAGFTVPGGYKSDDGAAILAHKYAFKAFLISDAMAMVFSLVATSLLIYAGAQMVDANVRLHHIGRSINLLWAAFVCMTVAFGMAAYIVVVPRARFVGTLVCFIAFAAPIVTVCLYSSLVVNVRITTLVRLGLKNATMKARFRLQTRRWLGSKLLPRMMWSIRRLSFLFLLIYLIIFVLPLL